METAMPQANRWNHSAPRVELDHRARQARIQLDLVEQMIVLRPAAGSSLFRRILSHFSLAVVARRPQVFQTRGPLSNRRPPAPRPHQAWPGGAVCIFSASGLGAQRY